MVRGFRVGSGRKGMMSMFGHWGGRLASCGGGHMWSGGSIEMEAACGESVGSGPRFGVEWEIGGMAGAVGCGVCLYSGVRVDGDDEYVWTVGEIGWMCGTQGLSIGMGIGMRIVMGIGMGIGMGVGRDVGRK